MPELVVDRVRRTSSGFTERYPYVLRPALAALLVSTAYYVGAKIGFALTFQPHAVSTLWPPNSILFAALVLSSKRWWWIVLLAAFPAHLLVQLNADIPITMNLSWFVSNCSEALIGASALRYLTKESVRFDTTRGVAMFILAAVLASFLSSFIDAGFVTLNKYGDGRYWSVYRMRFFSNVLASFTLVPLILTWHAYGIPGLRKACWSRYLEVILLTGTLLIVGIVSFSTQRAGQNTTPALLYLPLPLMLWAAIRFGPRGSSTALLAVSFFAIWGAIHGIGPFATHSAEMNALSVQLFLILASMPILFLAAVIKERERAQQVARQKEERLEMALDAAEMGTWEWRIAENIAEWSAQTRRIFGVSATTAQTSTESFYSLIHVDDQLGVKVAVDRALSVGCSYEAEFRIPQNDGSFRWVRGVGKVIMDQAGRPARMSGVNIDITKRKAAEEVLHETSEQNRAILRALPDFVFVMSNQGIYLDYHTREPEKLLVPPATFVGKSVRDVLPPDLAERVMQSLAKTSTTDEPQSLEYSLPIGGEERHYEARLIGMDGDKTLSIVRDVTDRERASQALRDSQKRLRQSHDQVSELLGRLIDVQESERRRISRELHDDLSQRIATLSVSISRLKKKLPMRAEELITELDQLRLHTDDLTNEIRSLSHRLHPAVLEHLGLVTALESYIASFKSEEEIDVTLTADVGDEKIPFQTSICIYRIALEALRNVSRHSGASSAVVSLKAFNKLIELQVSDGGKGFDVESVKKSDGLGLVSIEERLRVLQGTCEIRSTPENGTTLVARVPLTS